MFIENGTARTLLAAEETADVALPPMNRREFLIATASGCVAAVLPGVSRAGDAIEESVRLALLGFVTQAMNAGGVPGVSAAVVLPGDRYLTATAGWADRDAGRRMAPVTRMMSGSTGKTFCAATALALSAAGRIDLDAPLAPAFHDEEWFRTLPNADALTTRMLLNHTAGFPQFLDLMSFQRAYLFDSLQGRDTGYSPRRMLGFIAGAAPLNAPGKEHHYSDLHYHLVGLLIEKVTGLGYYEVLQQQILGRLPFTDIIPADRRELPGLAAGYARGDLLAALACGTGKTLGADGALRKTPVLEYTGGGLAVTPRALAVFYSRLLHARVIPASAVTEMLTSTAPVAARPGLDTRYGLGVYITHRPGFGRYVSHSGFFPGYNSNVGYFEEHGFSAAVQITTDHGPDINELWRDLAKRVIGVIQPAATFA